jgi:3D-(3,5/4)-trihydroxycyclohexane-1,2-dione acylhydrolase (decyclizing)
MAASLVSASNGLGVWYLFGDETTQDEGPNMQQIPAPQQGSFLRLCQTMGQAYTLHTPESIGTALRRGLNVVDHPHRPGPFFLLMPMNTQCAVMPTFGLDELPEGAIAAMGASACENDYVSAARVLKSAERVVVKVGGGARDAGEALATFLDRADAVAVTSPLVSGVIPYTHRRNMTVGGSKGSVCGNYAMEQADVLVAIGTRAVCQSDCSRTAYPNVRHVIAINTDADAATHYAHTTALVGDAAATLRTLLSVMAREGVDKSRSASEWFTACSAKKREWEGLKAERYRTATLPDAAWGRAVLTQPAAIKVTTDWARQNNVVTFFDAGDVQANGFQIVEDERLGQTFTETGASYMGFAVSALLATALTKTPFYGLALTGDGSFTMTPQILIDGVAHGATGCIVVLDNRRMAAISGLQRAQFGVDYATHDSVAVDYAAWARAIGGVKAFSDPRDLNELCDQLSQARAYAGVSLIHVPVYFGDDPLGGMGVFGRWNVGNWCDDVQALRHEIGL